jgi:hypothetical protein
MPLPILRTTELAFPSSVGSAPSGWVGSPWNQGATCTWRDLVPRCCTLISCGSVRTYWTLELETELSGRIGIPFYWLYSTSGHFGAVCYKPEGRGFDSRPGSRIFELTQFFQSHCGPWVDTACNKLVPGMFLRAEGLHVGLGSRTSVSGPTV